MVGSSEIRSMAYPVLVVLALVIVATGMRGLHRTALALGAVWLAVLVLAWGFGFGVRH
jgi:hypothetical protein